MNKPVLLSISLLVSGKEDMEKSLESLHFFKDAFPCEIILVDTGCKAVQRALAEKYADKIVEFEWCGDFAAARNAGLKEARGEWFMYLDDDEWFDNPQEIIAFFKTGEYKQYHCASYVVRNYRDMGGKMYDDSYPSRMVELCPETRFVGMIHEYLEPFKLPKKTFSDFVHHYGYVYKDDEDRKRHTRRNVLPLLEMIRKEPGEPRWSCQLAQEYFGDGNYVETIQACEQGIEDWNRYRSRNNNYAPSHVGALYAYILISLEMEKRYEEEEKWLKRAFEETPFLNVEVMTPTRAFYSLVAARMYSYLNNYEQSRNYFRQYIDDLNRYGDDRTLVEAGSAAVVEGVFQEQLLYGTVLMCVGAAIRMEDYALAEEAFFKLDWMGDKRLLRQNQWEKSIVEACCSVPYHPVWQKILQTLVSREQGMKEMLVVFLETEIGFKQQGEQEKLSRLNRLAAELDYEHSYILSKKLVWLEKNMEEGEERNKKAEELLEGLFAKYPGEIFDIRAEVWDAAERMGVQAEPFWLRMDYNRLRRTLDIWSRQTSGMEIGQWDTRIASWKTREDIRYSLFVAKCLEGYLHHYQEACPGLAKMEEILWKYADSVLALHRPYYREFVFEDMPEVLPEEAQLALKLQAQKGYREQGDDLKALENVRKCLGVYPVLDGVLSAYASMYRDEVQKRGREAREARAELQYVADRLKKTARLCMDRKEYQEAKKILLQVIQCLPGDSEAEMLLARIEEET